MFVPQRKYKQTTLTIVLPILILGWVSMMAILIPVKSGEKISFLIAIELGLVFIIATLDTNMVPAGRGFKLGFDITIFTTCPARFFQDRRFGRTRNRAHRKQQKSS